MAYTLFKFLHVTGAIVWVGGVIMLAVLHARLAAGGAGPGQASLAHISGVLGRTMVGPAAALTLVAGVAAAGIGGSMGALWTTYGFVGILVSMGLGSTAIRRTTTALQSALVVPAVSGAADLDSLRSRLTILNLCNVAVLLSVVAAMVFKPTL